MNADAAAVSRVLAGDAAQFSVLVERYLPMARALCVCHVRDAAAHDDLIQEAFIACYERLDTLRDRACFGRWFAGIVRNICRMHLRSDTRR
ncbi:MAG: sigma-70 family RNA polymerase sigma factor, partial [Candidatus Hydrogenedentes bacterium]|nr:sigma-70 family RNA polymerase sigma factor [Candidatus Hydrogenedentota bacterium]